MRNNGHQSRYMRMKLFFVLLLISPFLFSQENDKNEMHDYNLIDTLIKGDWQLARVEIVDGYDILSDTNRFKSQESMIKKITITSDSIHNHRDSTLRFYTRNRSYSYRIKYDSIIRSNYLNLYSGSGRHLREVESYRIVKCAIDELVIQSYQFLDNGLDYTSISIVYTYRKNGVSDLLNEIKGKWVYCSTDDIFNLFDSLDTSQFTFTRISDDTVCGEYDRNFMLDFSRSNLNNMCYISSSTKYSAYAFGMTFMLDPENDLLYFGNDDYIVYDILSLNQEELVISLNREKTEFYKTRNTHNNK